MPDPTRPPWREKLLLFAIFGALTLLLTWPVGARLGAELAGGRDDLWVHQWTFWSVREALRNGVSPFFTTDLYFPQGVSLTSHNIAWFNIATWLPLQALFGRTAAYNLVFLLVITLNGFCMYLFARAVIRDRGAAFVAGFIFGFWPYTLSHYDHANMMVLFWVPLTLLLLTRLIVEQNGRFRWGLVLATAVSLAMIGITRWQLLIMSSPILLAYPLYLLGKNQQARTRSLFLQLFAAGGLAALIMAPLAAPLIIDQFTREFPEDVLLDEAIWGRTDLLAYFIPSINNSLWARWVAPFYENFVVNKFYTPYLSYTAVLLALAGLLRRWRETWIWLLSALLYFALALGPELAINGTAYPMIPMPYRLIEDWFVMGLIRRPDRLNVFLSLPLAMMAGWGMAWLLSILSSPRVRWGAGTAVTLLLLLAYWPAPFATTALTLPAWYTAAAEDGEPYAVLDLPINDRSYDKWYMAYQTLHGKPLATGHVSRRPREATVFLDSVPLLADLEARDQLPDPALNAITEQLHMLDSAGIRYLVIHKQFANEGLQGAWREWLAVEPFHEDNELLVYRTAPQFGQDFSWTYPLNEDLGLLKADYAPHETVQGGAIAADLVWGTAVSPNADYMVCLQLRNQSGTTQEAACAAPGPAAPTSTWPANDVRRGRAVLPIGLDQLPGAYQLELYLAEQNGDKAINAAVVLGDVELLPFAPMTADSAAWKNGIHLMGYTAVQEEDALALTLYWQAAAAPDTSYKVFIHVIDPQTGAIVAQSDTIPRDWTYPTDGWQAGEIVRDLIHLPLENVPAGQYNIRVGLYNEETGQRAEMESNNNLTTDAYNLGVWVRK
jgi:hypothetical protein